MRFHKVHYRDPKSLVQITNALCTRDLVKSVLQGKQVELSKGVDNRSYDFPDGNVDFDASYITEASDLIEQSFCKDQYYQHLNPKSGGTNTEPLAVSSEPPVVDPTSASND